MNIIDFKNIRIIRQKYNNALVYKSIKSNNISNNIINKKALTRILDDIELDRETLFNECRKSEILCKIVASSIAINASRQGIKDEHIQLDSCKTIMNEYDIDLHNLSTNDIRPTKDGKIITKKDKIPKDKCLKSFDAKLTGNITGYISAKVIFGSGGHQDNAFEEMDVLAQWWNKYGNEYLIILIDTDLNVKFTCLKNKYSTIKNILICNHIELQQHIITNFKSQIKRNSLPCD